VDDDEQHTTVLHGRVQAGVGRAVGEQWPAPNRFLGAHIASGQGIQRQKPPRGLIHHSERGSQYASHECRKALKNSGLVPSMSRKANCWDNAPKESFFGTLKTELVNGRRCATRCPLFQGKVTSRLLSTPGRYSSANPLQTQISSARCNAESSRRPCLSHFVTMRTTGRQQPVTAGVFPGFIGRTPAQIFSGIRPAPSADRRDPFSFRAERPNSKSPSDSVFGRSAPEPMMNQETRP
jgi:transposase InsO family protein